PCAARTAACASAPSTTICEAEESRREPPAVSVIPPGPRVSSWSPRCCRRADRAWDTAGSLTPSAFAAAVTEPSRATSTNAFSCVSVITTPLSPDEPPAFALVDRPGPGICPAATCTDGWDDGGGRLWGVSERHKCPLITTRGTGVCPRRLLRRGGIGGRGAC